MAGYPLSSHINDQDEAHRRGSSFVESGSDGGAPVAVFDEVRVLMKHRVRPDVVRALFCSSSPASCSVVLGTVVGSLLSGRQSACGTAGSLSWVCCRAAVSVMSGIYRTKSPPPTLEVGGVGV